MCSLDWLNHFIDFFRGDFLVVLDRARSHYLENNNNNNAALGEESKELTITEEVKEPSLMIDTSGNNGSNNFQQNTSYNQNGLDLNDLRKNKCIYLDQQSN